MKLFAFDFDKTITRADTILPLSRYLCTKLKKRFIFRLIQLYFILFRLKLIESKKFKSAIVRLLLKNSIVSEVENYVFNFFKENADEIFNPEILTIISNEIKAGNKVIIISSNLDPFVRPFSRLLAVTDIFATKVKRIEDIIGDTIEGDNCSGSVKAKILKDYKQKSDYKEVISYGDSSGDYNMLNISDKSFIADYQFNNLLSKIRYRIENLNGRLYTNGLKITFKEFENKYFNSH